MKKALFILLSIALLCSMMTIAVYADSEAIAEDTAATTANEEPSEAELRSISTEPPISEGVYRFDSMYNNGMCMMVEEDGYFNGALVLQWNTSINSRDTLFKVEYAGYGTIPATNTTEYYYVIRSMVNSAMGLTGHTDGSVCLRPLVANNSNQATNQYWVYTEDSGCAVWMNAYTGEYLGTPTTASNGDELVLTSSTTRSWWQMSAYSGGVMEGVEFMSASPTVYGGATVSYQAYMYSSRIGVNGPVHYSVTCNSGDATIQSDVGALSAKSAGSVEVRAYVSGMSADATCTVNIIGYSTADRAAAAFAKEYYGASAHVELSFISMIYSTTSSGVTTYHYTAPVASHPHHFQGDVEAPAGGTEVAIVFIELERSSANEEVLDDCAEAYPGLDLYVMVAGNKIEVYDNATTFLTDFSVSPRAWESYELTSMENAYREFWRIHMQNCSTCSYPEWYMN